MNSDEMYAANLATADLDTVLRERDSHARTFARYTLKGDRTTAALLLARFEIADAEVERRFAR